MLMRTLFFALLAVLSFAACEKDTPQPKACETQNFGLLCVKNNYTEAVNVTINSQGQGSISVGETSCYNLRPGTHQFYAEESSFILLPDYWEFSVNIAQCEIIDYTLNP